MFRGEFPYSMALEWKGPRSEVVTQICFLHKMCLRQSSRAEQEGCVAASTPWIKELTTEVFYLGLTLLLYKISWKCHRVVPPCPCTVKLLPSLVFISLWIQWYLSPTVSNINTVPGSSPAFHHWWGSSGRKQLTVHTRRVSAQFHLSVRPSLEVTWKYVQVSSIRMLFKLKGMAILEIQGSKTDCSEKKTN